MLQRQEVMSSSCAGVCVCVGSHSLLTLSNTSEVGRSWGIFCRQESTKLRKESDLHVARGKVQFKHITKNRVYVP